MTGKFSLDAARARSRRWVANHPERSKQWREANPGKADEYTQAWVARNPEKRSAQIAVGNALRDGKLVRPTVCSACGSEPAPNARGASRIEAHHEDYSRPMDVTWLCKPCHKAAHRKDSHG